LSGTQPGIISSRRSGPTPCLPGHPPRRSQLAASSWLPAFELEFTRPRGLSCKKLLATRFPLVLARKDIVLVGHGLEATPSAAGAHLAQTLHYMATTQSMPEKGRHVLALDPSQSPLDPSQRFPPAATCLPPKQVALFFCRELTTRIRRPRQKRPPKVARMPSESRKWT